MPRSQGPVRNREYLVLNLLSTEYSVELVANLFIGYRCRVGFTGFIQYWDDSPRLIMPVLDALGESPGACGEELEV